MARKREVILLSCDVIAFMVFATSITLLIIGVKDSVAIWEGFGIAFLFMYWKNRYKIYIVRREREKIAEIQ
ncbi:MAG: hypothetical protein IKU36_01800 [Bacteroidales bacterium]|nr:hypothetical protein [Bacteroidales bacterium]